jgi:leucyl aminopeptidase
MDSLLFLADSAPPATPIHVLRASEWPIWIETRPEPLRRLCAVHDFKAQAGRILLAPATDGGIERVLFGLGEGKSPLALGTLSAQLPSGDYKIVQAPREFSAGLVAIAWGLGAYSFDRYKPRKRPAPRLAPPEGADMAEARRIIAASYLARDLINTPTNEMGPETFHARAEEVAKNYNAGFEAIVGDDLLTHNYPLIHAVGRAAAQAPRLLHLTWGDESAPRVTLVGKGVTFDTGGLNLKPESGMRLMKKDMGGAAHALALAQIVMDAGLPVRLDVYLPVVENSVSGDAFRPGDVIASRKGASVEIDNTDAEGRLILADALARASEDKPDLMLDFATLTGAARTALGPDIPPFFSNDDVLADQMAKASAEMFDPLWRMPLWPAYEPDIESLIADLKNAGDGGMAGAIYAALFLKRFVDAKSWGHFDVYAWAPRDKPSRPQGGEAQTLRACWRVLKSRYGG